MSVDPDDIVGQRRARFETAMNERGVSALLTADPVTIRYATGTRNMLVHGLTGPDRLALIIAGKSTILWEFAGCEHLTERATFVDEQRPAPALTAKKTTNHAAEVQLFSAEIASELKRQIGESRLAVERIDLATIDGLRAHGVTVTDAVPTVQAAMCIKQPAEIEAMHDAMRITQEAAAEMEKTIAAGLTEQQVWGVFYGELIARGGELVVTRLLQSGERTFPYFHEASDHVLAPADLVCFDSDAVALNGYSVDFSRTFLCGDAPATTTQRHLYELALDQLEHNSANLHPGVSFEDFARKAFEVPEPYAKYGYYQLAHGLGMLGGHPNIPRIGEAEYPLPGGFEPGMVICVESYVGDPDSRQGVKLENQFLVLEDGVELMSTYPMDPQLSA